MNAGKIFEKCFKDSIPDDIFYLRLRDGTAAWDKSNSNVRFQAFNVCDCILHYKGFLFMTELKSHKGKSIPFTCFRETQLNQLIYICKRANEIPVAIFNFRDAEETYLIKFQDINEFIYQNKKEDLKKSFPIAWCREVGIRVQQQIKKVHYSYDIKQSLEQLIEKL